MKNVFKISMAAMLSLAMGFGMTSCNPTTDEVDITMTLKASNISDETASVSIESIGKGVTGFKYAIGKPNQKNDFINGTLEGIKDETNMSTKTLNFEGLTPATAYSVFVQPYAGDKKGLIVICNIKTAEEIIDEYELGIEWVLDGLSASSITVKVDSFGRHTTSYEYAIGKESDLASFEDGSMVGIQRGTDAKPNKRFVFTGLTKATEYTIFARACRNEDDEKGPVKTMKVKTFDLTIAPKVTTLTSNSVTFDIKIGADITSFKYIVEVPEGAAVFEQDLMDGIIWVEDPAGKTITKTVNNLKPNTKYTIYAQGFANNGSKTVVIQHAFTTKAE